MDDNNDFLSSYNKRDQEPPPPPRKETAAGEPKSAAASGYKYEQKSGFKPPERRESYAPSTDNRKRNLIIGLSAGGGALVILIVVLALLLTAGTPVEELTGRTQTEAQLWANQNNLNLQATEVFSDDVEAGTVISQETAAGTRVRKGGFVYITVSKGPDLSVTLTLPDLLTMTKEEVEAWAEQNHMTKVRVTTEFSATVAAGKVIRFEINDNTVVGNEVKRDTPVYVIVSKGIDTTVEQIEAPDFKTMTLSECYVWANDNGMTLTVTEQYDDYIAEGSIISSSVKAKDKILKGTEIKLVASKGKKIEIPDFSDYNKDLASSVATGLGIPVTIVEKYSGSSAGAFISQSIAAGTIYEKGDYLELSYSLGNKIVVPSFVGQTLDALESWKLDLNAKGAKIKVSSSTTNSSAAAGTIITQDPVNESRGTSITITVKVSKGKLVSVPDFTSGAHGGYDVAITREEAIEMCSAINLIPVFVEGGEKDDSVRYGAVWDQSEAPGSQVNEGSTIKLTYRPLSNNTINVDDIVILNKTEDQLRSNNYDLFKKFNLKFVAADKHTDGADEGVVVAQSIPKGTPVKYGTTITLYTNPPDDTVIDPDETPEP
jgi:beta-lactam-binding protein with PASTA domain